MENGKMKIVSWNCNYDYSRNSTHALTEKKVDFLMQNGFDDADIYAIQETREKDLTENIEKYLGRCRHWYCDFRDSYSGIALFSDRYIFQRINERFEKYRYVVPYFVKDKKTKKTFFLVHIWTKSLGHEQNSKNQYIKEVLNAIKDEDYAKYFKGDEPTILLGDFNSSPNFDLIWGI